MKMTARIILIGAAALSVLYPSAALARRDEGPIRSDRHAMIIEASDVLNYAVASGVPNIDAEGEVGLGLHGQVRLDLSWPAGIYTPCCCVA